MTGYNETGEGNLPTISKNMEKIDTTSLVGKTIICKYPNGMSDAHTITHVRVQEWNIACSEEKDYTYELAYGREIWECERFTQEELEILMQTGKNRSHYNPYRGGKTVRTIA